MSVQHQAQAGGRWGQLTLCEQMGNIGSEVGRTLKNPYGNAAERALELFDLTLADKRWHGRGSEIARAREVFTDFVYGDNMYRSTAVNLEQYFMHFALAARQSR